MLGKPDPQENFFDSYVKDNFLPEEHELLEIEKKVSLFLISRKRLKTCMLRSWEDLPILHLTESLKKYFPEEKPSGKIGKEDLIKVVMQKKSVLVVKKDL